MKPTSPEQLARLLDQLRESYPHGIPLSAIQAPREPETLGETHGGSSPYHIFIAGEEGNLSSSARELLVGITSKGLKISDGDYTVSYGTSDEVIELASTAAASHVLVFGAERDAGWGERSEGRGILFTHSLENLANEPALKKELWRALQAILS